MEWIVEVTDADIKDARRRWQHAVDSGEPTARADRLRADYVRLISAQAQQIADDFRRTCRASNPPTP